MSNVKKQKHWKNRQQTSCSWREIKSVWVVKVGGPSDSTVLIYVPLCVYLELYDAPTKLQKRTDVGEEWNRWSRGKRSEVNRSKKKSEKNDSRGEKKLWEQKYYSRWDQDLHGNSIRSEGPWGRNRGVEWAKLEFITISRDWWTGGGGSSLTAAVKLLTLCGEEEI